MTTPPGTPRWRGRLTASTAWLSEDTVLVVTADGIRAHAVDGSTDSVVWTETAEDHLLQFTAPRPF